MNHGLNNSVLYSACKVLSTFSKRGEQLQMRGTGFFIHTESDLCFVTNRHVVDIEYYDPEKYNGYELISLTVDNHRRNVTTGLPTDIVEVSIDNFNEFIFPEESENDIACLKNVRTSGMGEVVVIEHHISIDMVATEEEIKNKLSVCDFVAFPGFPDWYDHKNNTPVFRSGTISSDPRFDYSIGEESMGKCIAYEAFSFGGSSGSPVFAIQKGFRVGKGLVSSDENFYREVLMIGINAGSFRDKEGIHSGISYMYKSSEILKLINRP